MVSAIPQKKLQFCKERIAFDSQKFAEPHEGSSMSHAATSSPDFRSMTQQLVASREVCKVEPGFSGGSELVPTEALSRMQREGRSFLRRPDLNGATVD